MKATTKTKTYKLKNLKPHPKNPKEHDKEAIRESLRDKSYVEPIVVDEKGTILAGHGRVEVMIEEGYTEADCVVKEGLTEKQKEQYVIAANKISERGGWDKDKLKLFSEEDLETGGFSSREIDKIFEGAEDDEDEFDVEFEYEHIEKPQVKPGEIYMLGEHRLMCGSATSKEDMEKLLDGKKADIVVTDPPYNMNYKSKTQGGIKNDHMSNDKFKEFTLAFMQQIKDSLKAGGVYYICSGWNSFPLFLEALGHLEMEYQSPIIWVKNQFVLGGQDYHRKQEMIIKGRKGKKKAEPILYGWKKGKHYWIGSRSEADVWEVKKRSGNTMRHPTQKPVALVNKAIKNSSKRHQIVLDPFAGSGTTLISAEKTARKAYLMELDPKYAEVILKRYTQYTGKQPKQV